MKQLVFRASERLLTFQDEELLHRDAGKCGEGGWVGYEGEAVLVATDLVIGDGVWGIEGGGSRVVFALKLTGEGKQRRGNGRFPHLVVAVGTTLGLLLDPTSGCRAGRWESKVLWPRFGSGLVMSIVVVYPRMACQLIGAGETLFTAGGSAGKGLFAGVCADVASLWWRLGLIGSDL